MTNEPNKRFPRVSDCCKASAMVSCGDEGTCCHICTKCKQPCDAIADEGLEPSAPSMSIEEAMETEKLQLSVTDLLKQLDLRDEIGVRELCPYGESIRLDAVCFNRYNRKIKGYEAKLTRQDFLCDKKWERYLPYCNYFSFIAPRGIIKKDELPEKIGLIEVFFGEKLYEEDKNVYIRSEIVKKMQRLHDVPIENYIKLLEGIALKATWKTHNIL